MINKKIQNFELNSFKSKGKLCSVFGEPCANGLTCIDCQLYDTKLWYNCQYAKDYKEHNSISLKEWENIIFDNMETKEIKINVPEGYEIDTENSTFECIKFKPVAKSWRNTVDECAIVKGWFIDFSGKTWEIKDAEKRNKLFATEKQAEPALAIFIP